MHPREGKEGWGASLVGGLLAALRCPKPFQPGLMPADLSDSSPCSRGPDKWLGAAEPPISTGHSFQWVYPKQDPSSPSEGKVYPHPCLNALWPFLEGIPRIGAFGVIPLEEHTVPGLHARPLRWGLLSLLAISLWNALFGEQDCEVVLGMHSSMRSPRSNASPPIS